MSDKIVYSFEPNLQLKAIQKVLSKRQQKQVQEKKVEYIQFRQHGLPSPPLEDKKFLSSQEIKTKLETLKQEKHELFQLMKKLNVHDL